MPFAAEVTGLHQWYGGFEAVRGVSLQVRPGELFALLGTNGAGKTTVLETLEGFRPAGRGSVRVLGRDPHRDRARVRPQLGIMMQEGGLFPDLTVAETLDLWRDLTPEPRDRAELLGLVNLADRAKVGVRQLSGGQKRRLGLALAITGRPRMLFLDEPTTGMDPEARHAVWQVVRGLVADGTTVLLSTHYLEEAEQVADRLAIMHHGRFEAAGTLGEVLADHGDRISFRLPPHLGPGDLPAPGGVRPVVSPAGEVSYTVNGLQEVLHDLLRWADGERLALADLQARSASLEDVFLKIAGGDRR
ncbi:MAG: ABC transporter ATP-binding protein [Streptosporangiaceae bacterium]